MCATMPGFLSKILLLCACAHPLFVWAAHMKDDFVETVSPAFTRVLGSELRPPSPGSYDECFYRLSHLAGPMPGFLRSLQKEKKIVFLVVTTFKTFVNDKNTSQINFHYKVEFITPYLSLFGLQ